MLSAVSHPPSSPKTSSFTRLSPAPSDGWGLCQPKWKRVNKQTYLLLCTSSPVHERESKWNTDAQQGCFAACTAMALIGKAQIALSVSNTEVRKKKKMIVDQQQADDISCDMLQINISESCFLKPTSNCELDCVWVRESIKGRIMTLFEQWALHTHTVITCMLSVYVMMNIIIPKQHLHIKSEAGVRRCRGHKIHW